MKVKRQITFEGNLGQSDPVIYAFRYLNKLAEVHQIYKMSCGNFRKGRDGFMKCTLTIEFEV